MRRSIDLHKGLQVQVSIFSFSRCVRALRSGSRADWVEDVSLHGRKGSRVIWFGSRTWNFATDYLAGRRLLTQ